jgi:PKD repeat protein
MFRNNCVKPFSLIQAIYAMAWVTVLLLMSLATAQAGQVTLAWNASTSAGVTGYHVVYGQASNNYTTQVDAGNSTQYTVTNLEDGKTYYFAVHAHDAGDTISSANSNEVSKTLPAVAPTASFSAGVTSGTTPLTVAFTNSSSGTAPLTYSWSFGDGSTSTASSPSKVYTSAGTYTVILTVTGPGGSNTLTRSNYITVTNPAVAAPVASFSATPTSGSAPLLVTLTDTSTGSIASRSWDFGNGAASTAQTAMVTYNTPGTYTVKLTVTGSGGTNTASKTIVVTAAPPVADFNANPVTGMAPLAATFTNTSSGTTTSYQWDFGDGSTSTVAYPSHTYTKAGTYTVKLTATGPAGSNTKTKTGYITVAGGGLVAAYNFNEASGATVVDASGQGNHGTINGATRSTTGKFGKALSFDGVNDWVSIPDADLLDLTTAMTLEAWVYPKNLADRRPILSKQGTTNGTPTRGFMFSAGDYSGTGKVEVELFKNETNSSSLRSTTALNTSGWQHVAFVYQYVADGTSKMTIYINGVVKGSSTAAVGPVQKNAQPLALGRYYWNSSYARYFNGLIDEVRIYNRALSTTEIVADMNKAVAF